MQSLCCFEPWIQDWLFQRCVHAQRCTNPTKSTNSTNSKMPSVSYKNTVTIQTRFKITLLHPPPQAAPAARHRRPACRSPAPRRRPWHRPSSPSTPPAAKAPGKEVEKICGCVMKLWTVNIHLLFLTYYPLLSLTIPYYPLLSLIIPYYTSWHGNLWLRFGNILDNDKPKLRLFGSFWGWQASTSEIGHLRTVHRDIYSVRFYCFVPAKVLQLNLQQVCAASRFQYRRGGKL